MSEVKIAGVTYANPIDEGQENRQDILKTFYGYIPTVVTLENVIHHNEETGLGEFAIKVRSDINGKLLGYIPKSEISTWNTTGKMIMTVGCYKNTYYGVLTPMKNPTNKQYHVMKSLVEKGFVDKMPTYDSTVYGWVFDQVYATNPSLRK